MRIHFSRIWRIRLTCIWYFGQENQLWNEFRLILDRRYEACSVAGCAFIKYIYILVVHCTVSKFTAVQIYITNTHMKRAWRFFSMGKPTHRIIFFSFEISFSHNEKSSHSTLKMKKKRQKKMLVLRTKLAIWRLEVSLNVYNNEKENQKKKNQNNKSLGYLCAYFFTSPM